MKKACNHRAPETCERFYSKVASGWRRERTFLSGLKITILVALLVFDLTAQAQFRSTQWTADSGLPQNIIRGIVQTPDGYLLGGHAQWRCSLRWRSIHCLRQKQLTGNRLESVRRQVQGVQGDLWLYSESGAITRYHEGEFRTLDAGDGIPLGSAHGITSDSHGNVWIIRDKKNL